MELREQKEQTLKSKERIGFEVRLARIKIFLNPPYSFELPLSSKRLTLGDPGHETSMARRTLLWALLGEVDGLFQALKEAHLLSKRDEGILEENMKMLFQMGRDGSLEIFFPTQKKLDELRKKLAEIKAITENSVSIMKRVIEANK